MLMRGEAGLETWIEGAGRPLNVLVLDEEPPFPPDSGKKIRTWNLLTPLARRHSITYVCFAPEGTAAGQTMRDAGIEMIAVPPRERETGAWLYARLLANCFSRAPFSVSKHARRRFHAKVAELLQTRSFDLIHCEWTPYAQYAFTAPPLPVVIATHNIEADILRRRGESSGSTLGRLFFESQARRMERFERTAFARAECVTAVSTNDEQRARAWGARTAGLVANGVATDVIQVDAAAAVDAKELLFLGSLDWFPNVDAIRYFLGDIFRLVRALDPQVRLSIVGRRPDDEMRALAAASEGATLIGEVDDVRPYLARAGAVIVPLRIGGGTRIKILEAMAAGKRVVSTTIGAEGIDAEHEKHILLADTPQAFAELAVRALDAAAYPEMARAARERVEERYSWRLQAQRLEHYWRSTVD
jgi:glycosyltransferase involved in cell wall biosynthesis